MPKRRYLYALSAGLVATLGLTACSGGSSQGADSPQSVPSASNAAGKKITVWVMQDDYTDKTLNAINAQFTKQTGAKVDVQVQQWDGITTKITTALSTSTPPDVLDIGNTQVASFAATGGLADLTSYKKDLQQGQTWLGGLVEPATVDGKLYAVPGFAGARAVIYNKTMWKKAGVTSAPTTMSELESDLAKVKAAQSGSDFSPFYLPGQDWYVGMQFVWSAGGDLATKSGDTWTAGLSTPQAQKGLTAFKKFQNAYSSTASQTLFTDTPDQNQVFADGKTSAIVATNGAIANIQKANPSLKDSDLGTFAMPAADDTQPVMLGGSDWGIAAKSKNQQLALQWTKIAASPQMQQKWVFGNDGWIPNSTQATKAATADVPAITKGFFTAALSSKATPASPQWATIEGTKDVNNLFSSIASGKQSVANAAKSFDGKLNKTLNAG